MEPYQELEVRYTDWLTTTTGRPWYCVACNSGTAALHLALEALEVEGSIAIPEFTMVACARAASLARMRPAFIDCGDDLLINPDLLQRTPRNTTAVMPVHIYGRRCAMDRIQALAGERNWMVIEDLAEAHGVPPHPDTDAACWSFYRNKIVHGEEGGMVAFRNEHHACRARKLRSLGFTDAHDFLHLPYGHNYRLANLLAVPILKSLDMVLISIARRQQVAAWYDELIPAEWKMPPRDAVWVYDLRIPGLTEETQDEIIHQLNAQGIAARHAFKPMSRLREYRHAYHSLNAHRLSREVLYLPVYPDFTQEQVARIAGALMEAVRTR